MLTPKAWRAVSKRSETNFSLATTNLLRGRGNTQTSSERWIREHPAISDHSLLGPDRATSHPPPSQHFTGSAADYLLVAYAKEHEQVLVTHERPDPNARARIFIPDACIALGVEYADTFKMLRETGAHLDLRPNEEH